MPGTLCTLEICLAQKKITWERDIGPQEEKAEISGAYVL